MLRLGAVTHDLLTGFLGVRMTEHQGVRVAKIASIVVGVIAIVLGILFQKMNVNFLVGWAFSVAASANLPSLVMVLFWKGVTKQGVIAAVTIGMVASLAWILASGDTFDKVYGLSARRRARAVQPTRPGDDPARFRRRHRGFAADAAKAKPR